MPKFTQDEQEKASALLDSLKAREDNYQNALYYVARDFDGFAPDIDRQAAENEITKRIRDDIHNEPDKRQTLFKAYGEGNMASRAKIEMAYAVYRGMPFDRLLSNTPEAVQERQNLAADFHNTFDRDFSLPEKEQAAKAEKAGRELGKMVQFYNKYTKDLYEMGNLGEDQNIVDNYEKLQFMEGVQLIYIDTATLSDTEKKGFKKETGQSLNKGDRHFFDEGAQGIYTVNDTVSAANKRVEFLNSSIKSMENGGEMIPGKDEAARTEAAANQNYLHQLLNQRYQMAAEKGKYPDVQIGNLQGWAIDLQGWSTFEANSSELNQDDKTRFLEAAYHNALPGSKSQNIYNEVPTYGAGGIKLNEDAIKDIGIRIDQDENEASEQRSYSGAQHTAGNMSDNDFFDDIPSPEQEMQHENSQAAVENEQPEAQEVPLDDDRQPGVQAISLDEDEEPKVQEQAPEKKPGMIDGKEALFVDLHQGEYTDTKEVLKPSAKDFSYKDMKALMNGSTAKPVLNLYSSTIHQMLAGNQQSEALRKQAGLNELDLVYIDGVSARDFYKAQGKDLGNPTHINSIRADIMKNMAEGHHISVATLRNGTGNIPQIADIKEVSIDFQAQDLQERQSHGAFRRFFDFGPFKIETQKDKLEERKDHLGETAYTQKMKDHIVGSFNRTLEKKLQEGNSRSAAEKKENKISYQELNEREKAVAVSRKQGQEDIKEADIIRPTENKKHKI